MFFSKNYILPKNDINLSALLLAELCYKIR